MKPGLLTLSAGLICCAFPILGFGQNPPERDSENRDGKTEALGYEALFLADSSDLELYAEDLSPADNAGSADEIVPTSKDSEALGSRESQVEQGNEVNSMPATSESSLQAVTTSAMDSSIQTKSQTSQKPPAPGIALVEPVEWDVEGEAVWPDDGIVAPSSILQWALASKGYTVRASPHPRKGCFTSSCAYAEAREAKTRQALLTAIIRSDTVLTAKIALFDTVTREVRAVHISWTERKGSQRLEFLRDAVTKLLDGRGDIESGTFSGITWLRARPDLSAPRVSAYGLGATGAGIVLALVLQDQLGSDKVTTYPSQPLLPTEGSVSFLPGFFSGFAPPTSLAGRGGSGIAYATGAEAVLVSPAGIAAGTHPELIVLRSALPDGTPEVQAAFSAPANPGFAQGYSLRYRGDGLSDEAVLGLSAAADFGWFHPHLIGIQAGATVKFFAGEVGRGGTGEERSRGRSLGTGLDLGLRARLMRGIMAAVTLEDVASVIQHRNDFTDQAYSEIRPMRLSIGAVLKPSAGMVLTLDGRKGLYADQGDNVALGIEKTAYQVLRLRAGLQELFGRETVRKVSAGFGLRNEGFEDRFGGRRLGVDYAFEYGLDEAGVLAGGHRFGLLTSF